jgi:hypothetical protein
MQPAAPPAPHRLHWIPIAPSWIVSGGLVLLASMPHKIPATGRAFLTNPLGLLIALAGAAWLFTKHAVLGVATGLMIASVWLHRAVEGFANPPILIKDRVKPKSGKWFQESVLQEEPVGIQDRTEENTFLQDEVSPDERAVRWYDEDALDQHPIGIQERGVTDTDRDPDH